MTALIDRPLGDLLAAIASDRPAPGAGAGGAIALALGIACARKAVAISRKHRPDDAALGQAETTLAALAQRACEGADRDADRFRAMIDAQALPQDTEPDRAARSDEIRADAAALVRIADAIIACGEAVRREVEALADRIEPTMANDLAAAIALIDANRTIQSANRAENERLLG